MKPMNPAVAQLVTIGAPEKDPARFVCGVWLPGLYYGNPWFREIDEGIYFPLYQGVIERLLARSNVKVTAAKLKEDPDAIIGFSVWEEREGGNILHWIFVREKWRKKGIASNLIPPNIRTVTHLTKVGLAVKPKEWKFNPFL